MRGDGRSGGSDGAVARRVDAAADATILVDGPSRIVLDASRDGRFVLTGDDAGGNVRVIDRLTSDTTPVSSGSSQSKLSGNGRHVIVLTQAKLTSNDGDDLNDVFRITVSNGAVTLMTPGQPGWSFTGIGDVSTDGSRVAVSASNGDLAQTAPFVGDGTTTTELGSGFGAPINFLVNGGAYGISGDGNVVLYRTNRGADRMRTLREDLTTGSVTEVTLSIGGSIVDARISADGNVVVARQAEVKAVLHGVPTAGPLTPIGTWEASPSVGRDISVSGDGRVITWIQNQPTTFNGGTVERDAGDALGGAGTCDRRVRPCVRSAERGCPRRPGDRGRCDRLLLVASRQPGRRDSEHVRRLRSDLRRHPAGGPRRVRLHATRAGSDRRARAAVSVPLPVCRTPGRRSVCRSVARTEFPRTHRRSPSRSPPPRAPASGS